jgi:WD40 repeat protein/tetratricopeptide (TPR) repeat protein/tRNA A-37 threonylcarbamoyl transferase component Bud32
MTPSGAGETPSRELAQRVRAEQRRRWRQGERPAVEEFLAREPPLQAEREVVLELIYNEVVLREERGERPQLDEYVQRFPELAPDLRPQFEVHAAVQRQLADAPTARGEGTPPSRPSVPGYDILREVGRGGMGVVYLARQERLRRPVALKMILAGRHAGAEAVARFLREAEAVAAVQHPNIVQIYEVGEADGLPFLALEYVGGGSLEARLAGKPLPPRAAAQLARTLAQAMHHAHQAGVVHRDLKPANILLSAAGKAPDAGSGWDSQAVLAATPKVTDFGLAKLLVAGGEGLTRTNELLGTPSYMAPEQTTGKDPVGPPADVYALGALLYYLLTGRPPFLADTPWATLLQVQHEEPVSPSRLQSRAPRDLVTICLKCLRKEPHKRYASAAALADDLQAYLDGRPITARPVGRVERAWRWCRRNPALGAATAAVVLALVLGTVVSTVYGIRSAVNAEQAQLAQERAERAQVEEARQREVAERHLDFNHFLLAYREWLDFNVVRAEELVAARQPPADSPWEWGYLRRLCQAELLKLGGHEEHVRAVAFSSDGRRLATSTGIWKGNPPDPTGERGSRFPGVVRVWDAATGELLWQGSGHTGSVLSVAFSPDGRRLASASWDRTVRLWDVSTGRVERVLEGHQDRVQAVAYSPDGRHVASADWGGTVRLWDAATGRQVRTWRGFNALVFGLAFGPDGQLAAGSQDGTIKVWELTGGQPESAPPVRARLLAPAPVYALAVSPEGRRLAAGCLDHTVRVWERAQPDRPFDPERSFDYHGHSSPVRAAAFSPDGRVLASSDEYGALRLWEARRGRAVATLRGHSGDIFGLAFSPDGRRLASASQDRTAKVWDLTTDQESHMLGPCAGGLSSRVQSVAFSPDGRWLALSDEKLPDGATKVLTVYDRESGDRQRLAGHTGWVSSVAFRPDGRLLASGSADGTVRLWGGADWKFLRQLAGHGKAVAHVAFGPDGRLASAGADGTVCVWDPDTGRELQKLDGPAGAVLAAAFAADGRQVLAVSGDGSVTAWDAATGRRAGTLNPHAGPVSRVAFSADGGRLACWGPANDLRVWDVAAVAQGKVAALAEGPLRGHKDAVTALAFSPDGERLASAGDEGTVKLWDVRSGLEALTLRADPQVMAAVTFSRDGRCLATVGSTVEVWEAGAASPADRAAAAARRAPAWHWVQAQIALEKREWWAAAFHLDRLPAADLDRADWRLARGWARAELGQWEPAVADFAWGAEHQPRDVAAWYQKAVAQLGAGRPDAYRATCAEMLRRFRTDGGAARALYACVPHPGGDPAALAAQAEAARLGAGYERILGAVQYRTGRFAEAVGSFREAEAKGSRERAWDWLFLAMAHHRLGDREKARAYLARAADWIDEAERREQPGEGSRLWYGWSERVEVQALRREAEDLLRQPESPPPSGAGRPEP